MAKNRIPKKFRTFEALLEDVKTRRVKEAKAQFPPWYVTTYGDLRTSLGALGRAFGIACLVALVMLVCIKGLDAIVDPGLCLDTLFIGAYLCLFWIILAQLLAHVFCRKTVYANHPFISPIERREALLAAHDTDGVQEQAFDEWRAYFAQFKSGVGPACTYRHHDLSNVRVVIDRQALDLEQQILALSWSKMGTPELLSQGYTIEQVERMFMKRLAATYNDLMQKLETSLPAR